MRKGADKAVLAEQQRNERIVQRLDAQVEIFEKFSSRVKAIPPKANPKTYFDQTLVWVNGQIIIHRGALGDPTSDEMRTSLTRIGENLQRKRAQVRQNGDSIEAAILGIGQSPPSKRSLEAKDIVAFDATSDPYSIVLSVEAPFMKQFAVRVETADGRTKWVSPDAAHLSNTPYILVNRRAENYDRSVKHERLHNVYDGTLPAVNLTEKLMRDISRLQSPDGQAGVLDPAEYIDALHFEIVPSMEEAISMDFAVEDRLSIGDAIGHVTDVQRFSDVISTAGMLIHELNEAIIRNVFFPADNRVRGRLMGFFAQLQLAFGRSIGHIENAFRRIEQVRDRKKQASLLDRLHLLIFLKKPSQYEEIETYFNAKAV